MSPFPVRVLWGAAGAPEPNWQGKARRPVSPPEPRWGTCALTGEPGAVWPLNKVTTTLTTLDRFPHRDVDPAGLAVGPAAAWALRHRAAMLRPHAIVDGCHVEVAHGPELYTALVAAADDPAVMVSVPVGQFGAQIIPWATWGHVGTDSGWWPWDRSHLDTLGTYRALRHLGFSEVALPEATPRWVVVRGLDRDERRFVFAHWADLDPWRSHPGYLPVAARATRTPKTDNRQEIT